MAYPFFLKRLLARSGLAGWLPAGRRLSDGCSAYLSHYGDRVLSAPYGKLLDAARLFGAASADVIDLGCGTPCFELASSARHGRRLPAELRGYPPLWGLPELRAAIAEQSRTDHGVSLSPHDEVLVTPGAAGAFHLALDAFINPGDAVVVFDPCAPLHVLMLEQRRARLRWIPTWREEGRTRFHLEPLVQALRGARMIVVNAPANPTGGLLSADDLEQLSWWADRRGVLLFSDDCYERFHYDGKPVSLGSFAKARGRLLSAGSFSMGFGLAAARVGWLAGCRHLVRAAAVTAALEAALVPTLCQHLALSALEQGAQAFVPIRFQFQGRRRYVFDRLTGMGLAPDWPGGGFFCWLPVIDHGLTGKEFADQLFQAKKVMLWPGDLFGPSGIGRVRLSFAGDEGRLRKGLDRIAEFLRARTAKQPTRKHAA